MLETARHPSFDTAATLENPTIILQQALKGLQTIACMQVRAAPQQLVVRRYCEPGGLSLRNVVDDAPQIFRKGFSVDGRSARLSSFELRRAV